MSGAPGAPTVSVVLPVLDEEAHLPAALASVAAQTYPGIVEVLVVDGGSTDRTREVAAAHPGVRVLANPGRIQAAALNVALAEVRGEVLVRVDGHCTLAPDHVERAVAALGTSGAAVAGGAMHPVASGWRAGGIAAAMRSPLGVGPARFHRGGAAGWVDTVYLGAFRVDAVRAAGGWADDLAVNEDAELAHRLQRHGGVWFDPAIRSTYAPRPGYRAVARQFLRYGRGRAATVARHPGSLSPRQLAAPALLVGLASPWRRPVGLAYLAVLAGVAAQARSAGAPTPEALGAVPAAACMHLPWAVGFLGGLARAVVRRRRAGPAPGPRWAT